DDFLGNVLLARESVHQQQEFAVHLPFLQSIFGTRRALSIAAIGIVRAPLSVSSNTLSPSTPRRVPFKRRAPSVNSCRLTCASSPAKRAKSASFLSGRSRPGELTSSRS